MTTQRRSDDEIRADVDRIMTCESAPLLNEPGAAMRVLRDVPALLADLADARAVLGEMVNVRGDFYEPRPLAFLIERLAAAIGFELRSDWRNFVTRVEREADEQRQRADRAEAAMGSVDAARERWVEDCICDCVACDRFVDALVAANFAALAEPSQRDGDKWPGSLSAASVAAMRSQFERDGEAAGETHQHQRDAVFGLCDCEVPAAGPRRAADEEPGPIESPSGWIGL